MTLRGEMQLYHLMAAPGAFLSFWCFLASCLSLIITFVIMSILLSFIYVYKRV